MASILLDRSDGFRLRMGGVPVERGLKRGRVEQCRNERPSGCGTGDVVAAGPGERRDDRVQTGDATAVRAHVDMSARPTTCGTCSAGVE